MKATENNQNKEENVSEGQKLNSSCGCGANKEHKSPAQQEVKYQCPMKCEVNKTYNQSGECPVCKMPMVTVGIDKPKIHVE